MKYFAFSDVHGHCTILKTALHNAGFDINNPDHCLIGVGDYFDRGDESKQLMEFLQSVPNKVLLLGNHELYLYRLLIRKWIAAHDIYNGVGHTLTSFIPDMSYEQIIQHEDLAISKFEDTGIKQFIEGLLPYFKTTEFVFTHACLPSHIPFEEASIEDWVRSTEDDIRDILRFYQDNSLLDLSNRKLKLVIGHMATAILRQTISYDWHTNIDDIWYYKNIIALDAATILSKQINIFTFEDEPLDILLQKQK